MLLNRHLERARIVFAIENEMSTAERNLAKNKYWTNVDGERYLQVEAIDKKFIGKEEGDGEDDEDGEDDDSDDEDKSDKDDDSDDDDN